MDCINWSIVGTITAFAFCGFLAAMVLRNPLKAALAHFLALPPFLKTVFLTLAVIATVEAQKQGAGNNEKRSIRNTARPSTVSDKEIAQGYRILQMPTITGKR
jgi:hypothetical protein